MAILVLHQRTLATGADRTQRRVPAEIGQIEAKREAGLQQVVALLYVINFAVYFYADHGLADSFINIKSLLADPSNLGRPGAFLAPNMRVKIFLKIAQRALQRAHRAGGQGAERIARTQ